MNLSAKDKELLLAALKTEVARVRRSQNASTNQTIKEILAGEVVSLEDVAGRVYNEPAKEPK